MAPFKSTQSVSVGKLLQTFRGRDSFGPAALNSPVVTDKTLPSTYVTTNADSINEAGGFKYLTWISPGSFTLSSKADSIYYLLVGGGGEGSYQNGVATNPGGPSTALGLTAYGGGAGAGYSNKKGDDGGSGGGGGGQGSAPSRGYGLNPSTPAPVIASFPQYVPGTTQGYPGGIAPAIYGGSGGGGAGAAGQDAPSNTTWRVGGIGAVAMAGDANFPASYGTAGPTPGRWFAAGGGGAGGKPHGAAAAQPVGGGGSGLTTPNGAPGHALPNTGSGGGGYCAPSGGGSGGGGAGGFLSAPMTLATGTYPITIGAGGSGDTGGNGADGIFVLRVPSTSIVS